MTAELEWRDWNKVEQCVERLPPEAVYLALRERHGRKESQVGRLPIQPSHLARYLTPERAHEEEDHDDDPDEDLEEEDAAGDEDEEDDDEEEAGDDDAGGDRSRGDPPAREEGRRGEAGRTALESATMPPHPSGLPSRAQLLKAAIRWVRATAEGNLSYEEITRFRLRAYGHKGDRPIISVCFSVRNLAWDGESGASSPGPAPVVAQPQAIVHMPVGELPRVEPRDGALAPYRALGQYYQQFGQVLANGYGQLQQINTAMITGLYDQLRQSHYHRDSLVTSVVNLRTEQLERVENRHRAEQSEGERNALARQALEQLGEATKAVFVSQGISPEHMEVIDSLSASPELMATLRDPGVRQLMRDPNNLRALAGLLYQIANQAQQAQAAGQSPSSATAGHYPPGMAPGQPYPGAAGGQHPQGMTSGQPYPGGIAGQLPQGMAPGQPYPGGMVAGQYPPGMVAGQVQPGAMAGQPGAAGQPQPGPMTGQPYGASPAYLPAAPPPGYSPAAPPSGYAQPGGGPPGYPPSPPGADAKAG